MTRAPSFPRAPFVWAAALTAIASVLAFRAWTEDGIGVPLGLYLAGLGLWTILEYALHRFVFHWIPANPSLRAIVDALHRQHHAAPKDLEFLFVRPFWVVSISILLTAAGTVLTGNLFLTGAVMCGVWTGFIAYEAVHHRIHLSSAPSNAGGWIESRRRAHFHHHFRNSRENFGVTTALWDHVFRTGATAQHSGR